MRTMRLQRHDNRAARGVRGVVQQFMRAIYQQLCG
jgi:hypothetical protein